MTGRREQARAMLYFRLTPAETEALAPDLFEAMMQVLEETHAAG